MGVEAWLSEPATSSQRSAPLLLVRHDVDQCPRSALRMAALEGEFGVRQLRPVGLFPYRCSDGLVYNFYHGALYSEPPAIYLGQTYRPYYRYTAARVIPRTYFCSER